jgi:hypothetical protein
MPPAGRHHGSVGAVMDKKDMEVWVSILDELHGSSKLYRCKCGQTYHLS